MIRPAAVLIALSTTACSTLPAPAGAQDATPEPTRQIHVNAAASVKRAPDRAVIQLAVETVAATAGEASDRNAAAMDRVLAAVTGAGVDRSSIRTLRLELLPRYDRSQDAQEPRITGYQAVNQVVLTLDRLDRVGAVVDAAVEAGANRVGGISFELSDPSDAYHEALRLAVEKARAEAGVVADALGEELGPALQVSTGGFSPPTIQMRRPMAMEAARAAPPVEPGELEVQASVSITYRLGT